MLRDFEIVAKSIAGRGRVIIGWLMICPAICLGEWVDYGEYRFDVNWGSCEGRLAQYNGTAEEVTIPSTFIATERYYEDGEYKTRNHTITVTALGTGYNSYDSSRVFSGNAYLKEVYIPNTVRIIYPSAFSGCTSLVSIKTPSSLSTLGSSVFVGCSSLKEVEFNGDGTLAISLDGMFQNCTSLEKIVFGDGVSSISGYIAKYASNNTLREINLGNRILTLPADVFANCFALETVTFSSVTNIGASTFYGCTNLSSISLADVRMIDDSAFKNCSGLKHVDLSSAEHVGDSAFEGCNKLLSVATSHVLSYLGEKAFYACTGLMSATINGQNLHVGNMLFDGCTSITNVSIVGGVVSIDDGQKWSTMSTHRNGMFNRCANLKHVDVSAAQITRLPRRMFYNSSIGTVSISGRVGEIGEEAFYGCGMLTRVDGGFSSLTNIERWAFYGCTNLTMVPSVANVNVFGESAFYNCTALTTSFDLSTSEIIGGNAFYNCPAIVGDLVLPIVKSIGGNAFANCINITSVRIASTLSSFSDCFSGCINLKWAEIDGDGHPSVGGSTFDYCSSLERLVLGDGIKSLGSYTGWTSFNNCKKLREVSLGSLIEYIPQSRFAGLPALKTVSFTSVTNIAKSAFSGCTNLTEISSLDNVRTFGDYAFNNCRALDVSVSLTAAESIGSHAFTDCHILKGDLTLSNIRTISDYAFASCYGLSSLKTGTRLSTVGYFAFGYSGIQEAEVDGNGSLVLPGFLFGNSSSLIRCTIGDGVCGLTGSSYSSSFGGCSALREVVLGRQITTIPSYLFSGNGGGKKLETVAFHLVTNISDGAFSDCVSLSTISSLAHVQNIGANAFYNCRSMTGSLSLPKLATISSGAFSGCSKIESVQFGTDLTSIGSSAFYNCTNAFTFAFASTPPSVGSSVFNNVKSGAIGTYTAAYAAAWEAVIDANGYWNGLKMRPGFSIRYDANNGSGCVTDFIGLVGSSYTVEDVGELEFTWKAHCFQGWAFAPDGEVAYRAGESIDAPTDILTLYGVWATPALTLAAESADWANGWITLRCTDADTSGRAHTYTLQYYDESTKEWKDVTSVQNASACASLTDTSFSSRLGGIPPVNYRVKDENDRVSEPCVTRNRYLLAVGYNAFLKQKHPKKGHYNDASRFRSLCVARGEFQADNAHFIANGDATTAKVRNEMYNFAAIVQPGDLFVFYISTHGGDYDEDTQAVLATYDSAYTAKDLLTDIRRFPAGTAVINVIMACHSFAMTGEVHVRSKVNEWLTKCGFGQCLGNVAWVTSCDAQQSSYTVPDEDHSRFGNSFIVNGFGLGCADGKLYGMDYGGVESDGNITFGELFRYSRAFFTGMSDNLPSTVQGENEGLLDRIVAGRNIASSSFSRPCKPTNVTASQGRFERKIKVDWDAAGGAQSYRIYRYDEGLGSLDMKWVGCTLGSETTFVDEGARDLLKCILGKRYGYCVRAVNPVGMSDFSTEGIGWRGTIQYLLYLARAMGTESPSADDYDAQESMVAPNGFTFGNSWVAGLNPTNETSKFTVNMAMTNGVPYVTWSPNLNTNGVVRNYTVWGKTNLTDETWHTPTNSASRFFKVTVEMP